MYLDRHTHTHARITIAKKSLGPNNDKLMVETNLDKSKNEEKFQATVNVWQMASANPSLLQPPVL
jgi:hypothetical protein